MDTNTSARADPWSTLAATAGNGAFQHASQEMVRDAMDFLASRLAANAETLRAACACGSVTDLAALQQRWSADVMQAYLEAGLRATEKAMRLAALPVPAPQGEAAAASEPPAPTQLARGRRGRHEDQDAA